MVLTKCMICPSNKYKTVYNPYSLIRVFLSELFQRQHQHFKSSQATANKSACARVGGVYSRQCAAVKTTCGIKMRGCRCSPVGPRRAPDPPAKERERLRETRTRRAKASLRGTPGPIVSSSDCLCSLRTRPTTR